MNDLITNIYNGPARFHYSGPGGVEGFLCNLPERDSSYIGFTQNPNLESFKKSVTFHVEHLRKKSQPFSWITEIGREDPVSRYLCQLGFSKDYKFFGMEIELTDSSIISGEDLDSIVAVKPDEIISHAELMASELGQSNAYVSQTINHANYQDGGTTYAYMALDEEQNPVGYSLMIDLPGKPISILRMAVVNKEARGQGFYRKMFFKRILDAHARGASKAICYAYASTSADILEKIGMEKTALFQMHLSPWGT